MGSTHVPTEGTAKNVDFGGWAGGSRSGWGGGLHTPHCRKPCCSLTSLLNHMDKIDLKGGNTSEKCFMFLYNFGVCSAYI